MLKCGIISITLQRLYYTYHCFKTLKERAGCKFEHIVVDNGSTDGTAEWLKEEGYNCILNKENLGITKAMKQGYEFLKGKIDVIIKMDNDCEILTPNTIFDIAKFLETKPDLFAISPIVEGIDHHPAMGEIKKINEFNIRNAGMTGGIFRAMLMESFEKIEKENIGLNDKAVYEYCQRNNLKVAYLPDLKINHYETTQGQAKRYPAYFSKKYVY